jgi:hypothetical protein
MTTVAVTNEHGLIKWLTTPPAYSALGAILIQLIANFGRSVAVTAKQRHIRNVDRRFELNDTSLGTCTTGGPLMLFHDIDARDNHSVLVGGPAYPTAPAIYLPTADDLANSAFYSTLLAAQDYDSIALPYFQRYLLAYDLAPIVHRATAEYRGATGRAQQVGDRH